MYTPLDVCKTWDTRTLQPSKYKDAQELLCKNTDEALYFLCHDKDFLTYDYVGKYSIVNEWLIQHRLSFYEKMIDDASNIVPGSKQDHALAANLFENAIIANEWSKSKQVYQFDAEMELALADTKEVSVPVRILDRIPYPTIYVEFAKEGIFSSNFHGAFIHLAKYQNGYFVYIIRVKEDGRTMSGSVNLIPDSLDDGTFLISMADCICTNADTDLDWAEFGMFIMNALLYLCSDNAEIKENQTTKQTYRPSKTIKNKFSEVRKYECGYVYGTKIRKQKENESKTIRTSDKSIHSSQIRRVMRKHVRKAHWHHYWTGKGRTTLVLKWVAPVVVGTGTMPATIHQCQ